MRKSKRIHLRKTFFIFCEGETEYCYFEALKELKGKEANIKITPCEFKQLPTNKNRIESVFNIIDSKFGLNKRLLDKTNSQIFILLDTDAYTKEQINTLKVQCTPFKNLQILFTNQSFDFFILLHLEYFSGTTDDYVKRIKKYYKNYEKGYCLKRKKIHSDIIKNGEEEMIANIKKLSKYHGGDKHIKELTPFSEAYIIIEAINS